MHRRRFIKILASSLAGASMARIASAQHGLEAVQWNGYTLGAEGRFTLYTENKLAAQQVLKRCFAEIQRLEKLFSLYDHQSEICQLNRAGFLNNPSIEWRALLHTTAHAYRTTNGLFDPTIQPIWKAYSQHFADHPDSTELPQGLKQATETTGWQYVNYDAEQIRFERSGMQLTLNGIAQGFITDRITELLKAAGYAHVLVELGETRAIGLHPEQRPWNVGIKDARQQSDLYDVVELDNNALATSGSYGSTLSQDCSVHHLINPQTGRPSTPWKSLSVIAPTAVEADALSTGLSFAEKSDLETLQVLRPDIQIFYQA